MPEGKGLADRDHPGEEHGIEVAQRHGQRPNERLAVAPQLRCACLVPTNGKRAGDLELQHPSGL